MYAYILNVRRDMVKEETFSNKAKEQQLLWRHNKPDLPKENGKQNGVVYNYILPEDKWIFGVWESIRDQLLCYISSSGIQPNTGKHNLKSSWTQCANIFFPFNYHPHMKSMLVSFLNKELNIEITSINALELEYAAPGKLDPYHLLGESSGKRGSGQTSPDVAILFNCKDSKCGIYLIENKYTEHHFYGCSAAKKTLDKSHSDRGLEPNPNPDRCIKINDLIENYSSNCHQCNWGRKYWSQLVTNMNNQALKELPYCPAMKDGYQLFRQQALAQGIAESGLFDYVYSGVAYDRRNKELISCLSDLGIPDFTKYWSELFNTDVKFHCFTHQDLVTWVARSRSSYIKSWGEYIINRYGYK
jgi:hypothetical protein